MKTKALLLGAAIATAVSACATTTSPTGRTQYVGAVSQEQLNQLGEQAFLQAKSKTPQSRDGRQNAYVGCVVDAIVRQLPPQWRQLRWEEALFADQETNAWALPGGKVGVNDGIFKAARNQDQLAGVIAHEIGHVVSRHHDERITRQALASGVLQVGGAVAGARYGEGVGSAVTQGGGIFAQAGFLLPIRPRACANCRHVPTACCRRWRPRARPATTRVANSLTTGTGTIAAQFKCRAFCYGASPRRIRDSPSFVRGAL